MKEDEIKIYHKVCDISRICKKYFYERKYLPSDAWSMDKVVESIYSTSKDLKKQYEIWDHYKIMCKSQNNYFVGEPRLSKSMQALISFIVLTKYFSIKKLLSKFI